jgi:hypothetical protein
MDVVASKKSGECPQCGHRTRPSKEVFRKGFRCPQCGVSLYVSVAYLRILFVCSAVVGLTLVGLVVGIRNPLRLFVFGIPLGFVALMAIARIAPYFKLPIFLLRDPEDIASITTLDLVNANGRETIGSKELKSFSDRVIDVTRR